MSKLESCLRCGAEAKDSLFSNHFVVSYCRKCGDKYCYHCGEERGKECPECHSKSRSEFDKAYSK